MAGGKYNFGVKLRVGKGKSDAQNNDRLVKIFLKKWKKSGITKELREKSVPITKGQKERRKKYLGRKRTTKKQSSA